MHGQILTNKNGNIVKILGVCGEIIFVSRTNEHTRANDHNYTKEELISYDWIFPERSGCH